MQYGFSLSYTFVLCWYLAEAVFLHDDVLLLVDLAQTSLANLFDGAMLPVSNLDGRKYLREVALANPLQTTEIIEALSGRLCSPSRLLLSFGLIILKLLLDPFANNLMHCPLGLLALRRAVVHRLTPSAPG
jgi:hypothetical protein